jgi:hypothetical protein
LLPRHLPQHTCRDLIFVDVGEGVGVGMCVEGDGLFLRRGGRGIEVMAGGGVALDAGALENGGDFGGDVRGPVGGIASGWRRDVCDNVEMDGVVNVVAWRSR